MYHKFVSSNSFTDVVICLLYKYIPSREKNQFKSSIAFIYDRYFPSELLFDENSLWYISEIVIIIRLFLIEND